MTREEITSGCIYKITRKAVDYSQKYAKDDEVQNIVIDTFEDAAKFGYNLAIAKACEWLYDQACLGWIEDIEVEKFVAQFRKAMKGEEDEVHFIDANKKVDRIIGSADHIKTALDVLNKKGGKYDIQP